MLGGTTLIIQLFKGEYERAKIISVNRLTAEKGYRFPKVNTADRFVYKEQSMIVLRLAEIISQTNQLNSIVFICYVMEKEYANKPK